MGRLIFVFALFVAVLALVFRHYHHVSLSIILFSTAILSAAFGLVLLNRHPLDDLLEDMRRHAD
jgi:hypothetical protein